MAAFTSLSHQIRDITLCSICMDTLKEPKVLPCIHTFCLQCLDKHCESRSQEKEVSCPLCRTVFSIPLGGVKYLPNNFFIHQLLNVNKSTVTTGSKKSDKPTLCDLCSDSEAEIKATSYCIECDQHICDRCSVTHKKIKSTKSHQVVSGDQIPEVKENIKLTGSYCDQHPGEKHRLYCYDCKMIMCNKCLSKHSQHKCSDVSESAEKFCQQLNEDINKVSACILKSQQNLKQIELRKENFFEKIAARELEILQKYDQLLSFIQSQKSELLKELNIFKDKILKKVETMKDEIERQFVIRESFKRYCSEMIKKGTACDISRTAHDLHTRAEELVKAEDGSNCYKLSGVEITFKPSPSTTSSVRNFIGELVLRADASKTDQIKEEIRLTRFLTQPRLLHVMPSTGYWVIGVTVLGNEVFVLRLLSKDFSQVYVYKSDDSTWLRNLTITGSKLLTGLVSCSHYNCLYTCDPVQKILFRYDLTNNVTTNWSVTDACHGLSVTKCYNVIATIKSIKRIQEYTTHGSLVRDISHDSSIDISQHSVQLSTGNYVVSHVGAKQHRVCIVDQRGRIVQSYGGLQGSGVGQMNSPLQLIVDTDENVLVADNFNDRVQLLSPTLTYLGDIVIPGHQLNKPRCFHFDKVDNRLYIGEGGGGRVFSLAVLDKFSKTV